MRRMSEGPPDVPNFHVYIIHLALLQALRARYKKIKQGPIPRAMRGKHGREQGEHHLAAIK